MAMIIAFLKVVEYRYTIKRMDIDIYLGIIALIFTLLGIWVGLEKIKRKKPLTNRSSVQPTLNNSLQSTEKVELSEREIEVLSLMSQGLSNQEIADQLFISIHTVKTHCSNLFSKLQVKRRTQAIQKSKELGFT